MTSVGIEQSPQDLAIGYAWVAILVAVVGSMLFLAVQLSVHGSHHPNYRWRRARAWSAFSLLPLILMMFFHSPPLMLAAAALLIALAYPVFRDFPSFGRTMRSVASLSLLVLLGSAIASGRAWWKQEFEVPRGDCRYLESLRPEQAKAAADTALARGDLHLLGVNGYGLDVPGVHTAIDESRHPVRAIDCTSDYLLSRKHARLTDNAVIYARDYNRRVLGLSSPETEAEAQENYGAAPTHR